MDVTNETLNKILSLHESMKGCYFYTPSNIAALRRSYEDEHSMTSTFVYKDDTYTVEQETSCSCHNVYYNVKYYKNNKLISADIRLIKKILRELERATV